MSLNKVITSLSFFDAFSPEDLAIVYPFMEIRNYGKGELIIDEQVINTSLYFLLEGTVDIFVHNNLIARESGFGDVFGEMSISGNKSSFATIKSHQGATLLIFNFLAVHEVESSKKEYLEKLIYKSFSEVLANRLDKANRLINKLKKSA